MYGDNEDGHSLQKNICSKPNGFVNDVQWISFMFKNKTPPHSIPIFKGFYNIPDPKHYFFLISPQYAGF